MHSQCHPTLPVLATSGIEHIIKLWSPDAPVSEEDPDSSQSRIQRNQERTMSGPQVLRSISPRVFQVCHCIFACHSCLSSLMQVTIHFMKMVKKSGVCMFAMWPAKTEKVNSWRKKRRVQNAS